MVIDVMSGFYQDYLDSRAKNRFSKIVNKLWTKSYQVSYCLKIRRFTLKIQIFYKNNMSFDSKNEKFGFGFDSEKSIIDQVLEKKYKFESYIQKTSVLKRWKNIFWHQMSISITD